MANMLQGVEKGAYMTFCELRFYTNIPLSCFSHPTMTTELDRTSGRVIRHFTLTSLEQGVLAYWSRNYPEYPIFASLGLHRIDEPSKRYFEVNIHPCGYLLDPRYLRRFEDEDGARAEMKRINGLVERREWQLLLNDFGEFYIRGLSEEDGKYATEDNFVPSIEHVN